jgi:hypothetical protein
LCVVPNKCLEMSLQEIGGNRHLQGNAVLVLFESSLLRFDIHEENPFFNLQLDKLKFRGLPPQAFYQDQPIGHRFREPLPPFFRRGWRRTCNAAPKR